MNKNKMKKLIILLIPLFFIIFAWGFISGKKEIFPYRLIQKIYYFTTGKEPIPIGFQPNKRIQKHTDRLKNLRALPYLTGYKKAPQKTGVIINNKKYTYKGLNLYTSAHAPEAI